MKATATEIGWRKFFNSRLFLFAALIAAMVVVFAYAKTYYQDYQIRQQIIQLQDNARNLETRKLELLEALEYVKSKSFVEEQARTELNLVKPGEQMMVIPNGNKSNGQVSTPVVESPSQPNYLKWWNFFLKSR